jgi:type II secretory pathway predicted ATPase ExeA
MASTLDPLSLTEMEKMIAFRWQVASGGESHPFTKDALGRIFSASAGMPREANIVADNALLLAHLKGAAQIDAGIVNEVVADRRANLERKEAAAA